MAKLLTKLDLIPTKKDIFEIGNKVFDILFPNITVAYEKQSDFYSIQWDGLAEPIKINIDDFFKWSEEGKIPKEDLTGDDFANYLADVIAKSFCHATT